MDKKRYRPRSRRSLAAERQTRPIKGGVLTLRIPEGLLDAVDEQVNLLREAAPWAEVSRELVLRKLLEIALRSKR